MIKELPLPISKKNNLETNSDSCNDNQKADLESNSDNSNELERDDLDSVKTYFDSLATRYTVINTSPNISLIIADMKNYLDGLASLSIKEPYRLRYVISNIKN